MKRLAPLLLALSCAPAVSEPTCLETAPLEDSAIDLSRVAAFRSAGAGHVIGRAGAVSAGAEVRVAGRPIVADSDGAFNSSFVDSALIELEADGARAAIRLRDLDDAFACAAGPAVPTGTLPNDVAIAHCGDRDLVLVPTTADGAIQRFEADGAALDGIALPSGDGRGPEPFHIDADGDRAIVSLFGQHRVVLLDACGGALLHAAAPPAELLPVAPAIELVTPIDVDGDGALESVIGEMRPRHPQGVALVRDRVLVAFTGLLEVLPRARFGPAFVAAYDIVDDALVRAGGATLGCENPQSLAHDGERVWASCSGVLERVDGTFVATSDGALVALNPSTLETERVIPLGRFAPGTPAFTESSIVVGSLVRAEVMVLPRTADAADDGILLSLGDDGTESVFEVLALPGDLALAAVFGRDHLRAIDARAGTLDPAPFSQPIVLADSGPARGVAALAGGLSPGGRLRAYALLGLSAELIPLDLQQLVGP